MEISASWPRIPADLQKLIAEMAVNDPIWGEERIADELLLKIGIRISPRTIRRYMPAKPRRPADPKQRWMTFFRNHTKAIIASDFFIVVTATFQLVYVFVIMEIETRRILQFNVTQQREVYIIGITPAWIRSSSYAACRFYARRPS